MSRFTLDPAVRGDLDKIWDYIGIHGDNPAAAARQIEVLHETFVLLATQPLIGETRDDLGKHLRAFVVRPFVILYRPKSHGVEIVQVVHSARDVRAVRLRTSKHKDTEFEKPT